MSRRDLHPLVVPWAITLLTVLVWWWCVRHVGVWASLMQPLLPLILVPALWRSWRWIHSRGSQDRRGHERRLDNRRDDG
jgi:hypothetical protein